MLQHQPFSLRSYSQQPQDDTDKYIEILRQKKQDEEQVRLQNDIKTKKIQENKKNQAATLQDTKNKKVTYDFDGKVIIQNENKTKLPESYANVNYKVSSEKEKEVKQFSKIPNFVQKAAAQRRLSDLQPTPQKPIKQQQQTQQQQASDDNFQQTKKLSDSQYNKNQTQSITQSQDSVTQANLMFQHLKLQNGVTYKDNIGNNKTGSDAKLQLALQAALDPSLKKNTSSQNNTQQSQQPIRMSKSEYNELLNKYGRFSRNVQQNSKTNQQQQQQYRGGEDMKENRLKQYQQQFGEVTQISVRNGLTDAQNGIVKRNTLQPSYNDNLTNITNENSNENYGYLRQNQNINGTGKSYEKQSSLPTALSNNNNKQMVKNTQLPKLKDHQIKVNSQAMLNMLLE